MYKAKFPTIEELNNRLPANYEVITTIEILDSVGTVCRICLTHDDFGQMIVGGSMANLLEQMCKELGEFFMRQYVPLDVYPGSWISR